MQFFGQICSFFCGGYVIFCFVHEIKPFSSGNMVHIFQAAAKPACTPQDVAYLLPKTDYRLTVLKTTTQTITASEVHLLYFSIELSLNCFMLQCNQWVTYEMLRNFSARIITDYMNFQSEVHLWFLTFYILLLIAKLRSLVNVSLRNLSLSLRQSFKDRLTNTSKLIKW